MNELEKAIAGNNDDIETFLENVKVHDFRICINQIIKKARNEAFTLAANNIIYYRARITDENDIVGKTCNLTCDDISKGISNLIEA